MHLNLAEKNPSRLLNSLQSAFEDEPDEITIELIGPGVLYHDTALMLHEEMKSHAGVTRVHVRARPALLTELSCSGLRQIHAPCAMTPGSKSTRFLTTSILRLTKITRTPFARAMKPPQDRFSDDIEIH